MGIAKKISKYASLKLNIEWADSVRVTQNINFDPTIKQPTVLISYLDLNMSSNEIIDAKGKSGSIHTNRYELFAIIQAFIKLGFCIDVCSNSQYKEKIEHPEKYDYIFGLGDAFRYLSTKDGINPKKIVYMTENPYKISHMKESERVKYFKERHGKDIGLYRTGMFFQDKDEELGDALITVGNPVYYDEYEFPVKSVLPSAFVPEFELMPGLKNKQNFLVFGTDGFVHKGIDLLVDVFNKHPDWNLYLCGSENDSIMEDLGLKNTPNIIDCGYISANSLEFKDLVEKCDFILLPSCSEGTSTGVLTGMACGLVPVVMHGDGCELFSDLCIFFDDYHLDAIEKTLEYTQTLDESTIAEMSRKCKEFVLENCSISAFKENFYNAIKEVLDQINEGSSY